MFDDDNSKKNAEYKEDEKKEFKIPKEDVIYYNKSYADITFQNMPILIAAMKDIKTAYKSYDLISACINF